MSRGRVWARLRREPVLLLALVPEAIPTVLSFTTHVSHDQLSAIHWLAAALTALLIRRAVSPKER